MFCNNVCFFLLLDGAIKSCLKIMIIKLGVLLRYPRIMLLEISLFVYSFQNKTRAFDLTHVKAATLSMSYFASFLRENGDSNL